MKNNKTWFWLALILPGGFLLVPAIYFGLRFWNSVSKKETPRTDDPSLFI
ncbi:MAG: hypothetical protein HYS78_02555 [Parcubacteria group bacterium]|nr:hypothetical protein [Parcubacteria group bacterium]